MIVAMILEKKSEIPKQEMHINIISKLANKPKQLTP